MRGTAGLSMRGFVVAIVCAVVIVSGDLVRRSLGVDATAAAAAAFAPDGRLAYGENSGEGGIHTGRRTCDPDCDVRRVTTDASDATPDWSPTGRQIAFSRHVGESALIFVLDVTTGSLVQMTRPVSVDGVGLPTTDADPDWSPDGRTIVFSRAANGVVEIGFVSVAHPGAVRTLPSDPDGDGPYCSSVNVERTDPSFSSDGASIAYAVNAIPLPGAIAPGALLADADQGWRSRVADSACPSGGVWVSSTSTHAGERRVAAELGEAWAPAWAPDGSGIAMVTTKGVFIIPTSGGSPVALRDSIGNVPTGTWGGGGLFGGEAGAATGRVGWDPGSAFLVLDGISGSGPPVKYKTDGSGDLDTQAGTNASPGWSVQCVPATCLTTLTILRYTGGPGGTYPATFHFSGTVSGDVTIDDPLFTSYGVLSEKVQPGRATVSETTSSGWPLGGIECDAPAQVDVARRSVSVDIGLGTTVTCIFYTDLPVPSETPLPDGSAVPDDTGSPGASGSRPPDCTIDAEYHGAWVAELHGVDTLRFNVSFPWCYGGSVAITGPVRVDPEIGDFFAPGWISPIFFKVGENAIEPSIETGAGTIDVSADGSFVLCSSVATLALIAISPIKAGSWLLKKLPFGGRWLRYRILVKFQEAITKLLRTEIEATLFDDAAREGFSAEVKDVLDEVFGALYENSGLPQGQFCRTPDTWHPLARITLSASGKVDAFLDPDTPVSPFWNIKDLMK